MGKLIYLDNNATTQMAPEVIAEISKAEPIVYGNASSMHTFGREARKLVEDARMNVARLLDCNPAEITFTSGASEANNTVFMIAASIIDKRKGGRIVTTTIEHPSIIETVKHLRSEGYRVDQAPVGPDGRVKFDALESLMGDDGALIVKKLVEPEISTHTVVSWLKNRTLSAGAQHFISLLKELYQETANSNHERTK